MEYNMPSLKEASIAGCVVTVTVAMSLPCAWVVAWGI